MLKVKELSFSRGERLLFSDVTFQLKKGDFIGIVGASGSGKSTLLQVLAGLLTPTTGQVVLNKEIVRGPNETLVPGHPEIQLVNQEFALDPYHTVKENLLVKGQHLTKEAREELAEDLLQLIELEHLKNNKAIDLSGGEKQRLAIARALMLEPMVVLLDEPFAHLDTTIKRKVISYLRALNKLRKTTYVMVTHDGSDVMALANKVAVLEDSKLYEFKKPIEWYKSPVNFKQGLFFGELNKVKLNGKELLFRPDEFQLDTEDQPIVIKVRYKFAVAMGGYYENYFQTNSGSIIINHLKELNEIKEIAIRKS